MSGRRAHRSRLVLNVRLKRCPVAVQLPRPRWLFEGLVAPDGSLFRRLAVVFHGGLIVRRGKGKSSAQCRFQTSPAALTTIRHRRDVWQHSIAVGAGSYLLAVRNWLLGQGWDVPSTTVVVPAKRVEAPVARREVSVSRKIASSSTSDWCATSLISIAFSRIFSARLRGNSSNEDSSKRR